MTRTIKDATAEGFHDDNHDQLGTHLSDVFWRRGQVPRTVAFSLLTCDVAQRLKNLKGLTPCEYNGRIWTSEPDRFILNPIHQMPGLNNQPLPLPHPAMIL